MKKNGTSRTVDDPQSVLEIENHIGIAYQTERGVANPVGIAIDIGIKP